MQKIRTQKEFYDSKTDMTAVSWEETLCKMVLKQPNKELYFPGWCAVCKKDVDFLIDNKWSAGENYVNLRERLVCPECNLNNRMRAMAEMMEERIDFSKDAVYMYEQVTYFYESMKTRISNLVGSEYLGEQYSSGYINKKGIRHEDATSLSFEDESFKFIISNDVFEHVSDIHKTLQEAYRVLKPGGTMLVSVPFYYDYQTSVKRAEYREGELMYLEPPVYHGNPVDDGGSLVFYDYGWDLFDWIREAGFSDAYFTMSYSVKKGNIGTNLLRFLIAEKK